MEMGLRIQLVAIVVAGGLFFIVFELVRRKRLLERYALDPPFVLPQTRLNEVRAHVEGGLQDVSITRENVKWGVPLPSSARLCESESFHPFGSVFSWIFEVDQLFALTS